MSESPRIYPYPYNIKLVIEYDGSHFHGWQKQPKVVTVQSELERVLKIAVHTEEISTLRAAGRTDSGVHATGQVINFYCKEIPDLPRLKHAVSSLLKNQLSVISAEVVPQDFHALHSAKGRVYEYRMLNRAAPPTIDLGKVLHVTANLDIEKMQKHAETLEGVHDFTSFRGAKCMSATPVKTIFSSKIIISGDELIYQVHGKGFLKQMVRNIVGTFLDLQKSNFWTDDIVAVLNAMDRRKAGVTAPAFGLYLREVFY